MLSRVGGQTILGQDLEKAISAHKVECLGQVNEILSLSCKLLLSAIFVSIKNLKIDKFTTVILVI